MNELADKWGAALIIGGTEGSGFVVIAADDLLACERVAGEIKILDSRVFC